MPDPDAVRRRFEAGGLLLDGAMGSLLIAKGLASGCAPEEWNLSRPDTIREIHRAYLDAGAMVITTNTFGATPSCLERHGLHEQAASLNAAALSLARDAVSGHCAAGAGGAQPLVAQSIGPCGNLLPPVGNATEAEMAGAFAAQLSAAGSAQPPDQESRVG